MSGPARTSGFRLLSGSPMEQNGRKSETQHQFHRHRSPAAHAFHKAARCLSLAALRKSEIDYGDCAFTGFERSLEYQRLLAI